MAQKAHYVRRAFILPIDIARTIKLVAATQGLPAGEIISQVIEYAHTATLFHVREKLKREKRKAK